MGLFNHKKQPPTANEKKYPVPYSEHYRGFKIFRVVVHGNEESEKNNQELCKNMPSAPEVHFICMDYKSERIAFIYINGIKAGAIFDADQVKAIEEGRIEKIHAESDGNRLHFFAKYI